MRRAARPHKVTVTRYVDRRGRRVRKGDPGARKVAAKTATYYAWVRLASGEPARVSLGTTDAVEAAVRMRRRQREENDRAAGLVDDRQEHAGRPLAEHLADFRGALAAKGTSAKQVRLVVGHVEVLAYVAGWKRLPDLTADSLRRALDTLRRSGEGRGGEGASPQTRNHYLTHARQFAAWCVGAGRLAANPFAAVKPVPVDSDRRHDRRELTPGELVRLVVAAEGGPADPCGLDGPTRALLYELATATGLRAKELRTLTPESFDFDACAVTARGAYSKNRRTAVQQLPAWLSERVRVHLRVRGGGLFGRLPVNAGRVLRRDLARAGIPYVVDGPDGPLYVDFHSLRHDYISELASRPDMDEKSFQTLTRLHSAAFALRVYAKSRKETLRRIVDGLPDPRAGLVAAPAESVVVAVAGNPRRGTAAGGRANRDTERPCRDGRSVRKTLKSP